jgi:hypothetical protein
MAKCSQCDPTPTYDVGVIPCVFIAISLVSQIELQKKASLDHQMNYLVDEVDAMTGLYGVMPRREIPQPVVHTGPTHPHSMRIDRIVIGTINTGTVPEIVSNLNHIKLGNDAQVGDAPARFTQAVLADQAIGDTAKQELMDQISTLSAEAPATPHHRETWCDQGDGRRDWSHGFYDCNVFSSMEHLRPMLAQLDKHI